MKHFFITKSSFSTFKRTSCVIRVIYVLIWKKIKDALQKRFTRQMFVTFDSLNRL